MLDSKNNLLFSKNLKPIEIIDFEGNFNYTIAEYNKLTGFWESYVYWIYGIGKMVLTPDGNIDGISYITWWRPVDKEEEIHQLLSYDLPDFDELKKLPSKIRKQKMRNSPFYVSL